MTSTWCRFMISILILSLWSLVNMERIYPIASDLAPLLATQRSIISDLAKIIYQKKISLSLIEKEIDYFFKRHTDMKTSLEDKCTTTSATIAINTFLIVKRLTADINSIKTILGVQNEWNRNISLKYPVQEDLEEAVRMIGRVQKFYKLNVTQLADGILSTSFSKNGGTYSEFFLPMMASDCFQISKLMYKPDKNGKRNYKQGLIWLLETYRLFELDNQNSYNGFEKVDILQNICEGYEVLNDHYKYISWAKKLIAMEPKKSTIEVKIHSHEKQIRKIKWEKRQHKQKVKKKHKLTINPLEELRNCLKGSDHKTYRMLCRGQVTIAPEVPKTLKCWYFSGYHPFTKLAPFRAEQLYVQPDVLLFHNVVSETEIQTLKHFALPKLMPTTAANGPRMLTSMVYLIAKGAEVNANQSRKISQRISDFTGYATDATVLSVSNYGVGGHYVGHIDGTGRPHKERLKIKHNLTDADNELLNNMIDFLNEIQRTVSVVIYLSEVELGGATVFPVLGLSLFPIKGAALMWTNLLPSEDLDYATCHGVCPVLRGSRWTASQFIRHQGQELKKPCTKQFTSRMIKDISTPVLKTKHDTN